MRAGPVHGDPRPRAPRGTRDPSPTRASAEHPHGVYGAAMSIPTPDVPNPALAHAEFVRAVARGVLGRDRDVEDVLQDTFVIAQDRAPRRPGALRAWLGTIARRLSLDRLRADGRRTRRERAVARGETIPDVTDLLVREETRRRLVEAIARLDEPYRTVVLWRYYAAKPAADIAALLDVPLDTVRSRLQRALARLREDLDATHGGRREAWAVALGPLLADGIAVGSLAVAAGGWATKQAIVAAAAAVVLGAGVWLVARDRSDSPAREARSASAAPGEFAARRVADGPTDPAPDVALAAAGSTARKAAGDGRRAANGFSAVVTDPDGRPVAGAQVSMFLASYLMQDLRIEPNTRDVTDRAVTDAAGRVDFPRPLWADASSPLQTTVRVSATGWAPTTAAIRDGVETQVTLRRGALATIRVLGDDGRALEDAEVAWYLGEAPLPADPGAALPAEVATVPTAADGRAATRLPADTYRFRVAAAGRRPVDGGPVELRDAGTFDTDVALDAGIVVRFTVSDAAGGPVEGARVRTQGPCRSGGHATTDAKGACAVAGHALPVAGEAPSLLARSELVAFTVEAEGFVAASGHRRLPPAVGPFAVEVRLARGVAVRVRVVDASGAPIPRSSARWVALPHQQPLLDPTEGPEEVTSDGWITMPRVLPGPARLALVGGRDGRYERPWRDVTIGPDGGDLTVALARLDGQLLVAVRRSDDSPLAGAVLGFEPADVAPALRAGGPTATTDAGGRALLTRLRCVAGALVVRSPGRAAQRVPVDIAPGKPSAPLVVRLRPGRPIAGRVVGRDGGGVPSVDVDLNRPEVVSEVDGRKYVQFHTEGQTRTDAEGRFRFEAHDDEEYGLAVPGDAWRALGASRDARARPGTEDVVLRVKPASEGWGLPLRVRATSAGRSFDGGLQVGLQESDGRRWLAAELGRDADGARRFSLSQPPGTFDLTFYAPGHRPTVVRGVVLDETPDPTTLDVALDRGAEIQLRVLDADGAPRADTWLTVNGEMLRTDAAGLCVSTGWPVTAAPFTFPVALTSDSDHTFASTPPVSAPGAVTVTLRRRARLEVALGLAWADLTDDLVLRVIDAAGAVVDTQTVEVRATRTRRGDATLVAAAWADGRVRLEAVMGGRRAEADVDARVGQTARVGLTSR